MANSVITPVLQHVSQGVNFQDRIYQLQVGAGNYASPLLLDFTTTTNPASLPAAEAWNSGAVVGYSVDNGPVAYSFELEAGSALNNWGLKIATAGVELTGGAAVPAAVTGATDILIAVRVKTNKSV